MIKLKYAVAVWHRSEGSTTYAFPIGAKDEFGEEMYPLINEATWQYKGTLPRGMPVSDINKIEGNKIKCKVAGCEVYTADWALEEAE